MVGAASQVWTGGSDVGFTNDGAHCDAEAPLTFGGHKVFAREVLLALALAKARPRHRASRRELVDRRDYARPALPNSAGDGIEHRPAR